jgi:hypothetical protein
MTLTDDGIIISINPVPWNALASIRDNLDIDSNVTDESEWQREKDHSPKTLTDDGTIISINPVPENACASIRDNLDLDSNITDESE